MTTSFVVKLTKLWLSYKIYLKSLEFKNSVSFESTLANTKSKTTKNDEQCPVIVIFSNPPFLVTLWGTIKVFVTPYGFISFVSLTGVRWFTIEGTTVIEDWWVVFCSKYEEDVGVKVKDVLVKDPVVFEIETALRLIPAQSDM